ncbi:glycosyltransferase family 39 protein [bacterium]|nr:glycosyltransferase family 39 protein [bacterium]
MEIWSDVKRGWDYYLEKWRESRARHAERSRLRGRRARDWHLGISLLLLSLLGIAYAAWVGSSLSVAYIDLGDGNYLYTSSRMADGLSIYRDFLSPQPPLHLVTGSFLIRLGNLLEDRFGGGLMVVPFRLLVVRVFSIVLLLLTLGWMFLLGRRLTQSPYGGVLAAAIYVVLPIGFWWRLGYQSEPLEIFFLLGALWFFLKLRTIPLAAAGALMGLAVLTNMTAAPYALALLVYLIVRHGIQQGRRGWLDVAAYLVPLALVVGIVAGYYEIRTGAYFRNVIFNQVASYPPEGFWGYGFPKLLRESLKVISHEGGFILAALVGLVLYSRSDTRPEREFTVWYALVLLLSIAYVTKGGTMDYIFVLGEPIVALFAAYFVMQFFYPSTFRRFLRQNFWRDTSAVPLAAFVFLILFVTAWPAAQFILHIDQQFEQDVEGVERIVYQIRRHSKPDDPILSQPYYAFLSERKLFGEFSELYLWTIKYWQERQANRVGESMLKVRSIERALREERIPIVVANVSRPLILGPPEIREVVEQNYRTLEMDEKHLRTRNFDLRVFVPKSALKESAEKKESTAKGVFEY